MRRWASGILTVTSAVLGNPRGDEAEEHTSDDDGDCESDETEPQSLKIRHVLIPCFVASVSRLGTVLTLSPSQSDE